MQAHHRRSIRLKGYDYHNAGAYFVTLCTRNRECLLYDPVINGIIQDAWQALPARFPSIDLDAFAIMPNHIHFIVWLAVGAPLAGARDRDGQGVGESLAGDLRAGAPVPTLGDIVGAFKSLVFKDYLDWIETHDPWRVAKFWQRNYYEHIVRNDRELEAIRQYVIENPSNWEVDRDNLQNLRRSPPPGKVEEYLRDVEEMMRITL